jgi:hypothetical protein
MPLIYFPAAEWQALQAVVTAAERVDWASYQRARMRIASHVVDLLDPSLMTEALNYDERTPANGRTK